MILRDIPRTYPELEFFKDNGRGQQALFNVIKAYSIHDTEVGYCQGSAFIVGQLLLQVPSEFQQTPKNSDFLFEKNFFLFFIFFIWKTSACRGYLQAVVLDQICLLESDMWRRF